MKCLTQTLPMAAMLLLPLWAQPLQAQAQAPRRVYPYYLAPKENPDYARHSVKSPDLSLFNGTIAFTSLRHLTRNYRSDIKQYVDRDRLGNVIWPNYSFLFEDNLDEITDYIASRDLYLFNIWGFVPGSGPGGPWRQFTPPRKALDRFQAKLGDRWLGMDNGEQDGRYIGSYASRQYPGGLDRKEQYLKFHHHFQEMSDILGNRLSTLISLNYGHYYLKEGYYSLVGAETAQGLPNTQIYYSFIRGAGKQYGVSWFGNASVWNRWGYKEYDPQVIRDDDQDYEAGSPWKGTSLSLLKRLMYNHFFYNCVLVGFEGSFYAGGDTLSPVGRIQQNAVKWIRKNGLPGIMHTPVALLNDFFAGWTFPRHLYSRTAYRVWGSVPYDVSDHMTDGILDVIYPGYQDASYYHDERGFLAPTPYGDIADCLLSDAPLWLMRQYPVIVVADEVKNSHELRDKLEAYVQEGGHLVITSGSLRNFDGGLCGLETAGSVAASPSTPVYCMNESYEEADSFAIDILKGEEGCTPIATCGCRPTISAKAFGNGEITVIAVPFGVGKTPRTRTLDVKEDSPLPNPYPLLKHVKAYLASLFQSQALFTANPDLSLVTCVKDRTHYTVILTNSQWKQVPMDLKSNAGRIVSIRELQIPDEASQSEGYVPKVIRGKDLGQHTKTDIAGGGVRVFSIRTTGEGIALMDKSVGTPLVPRCALKLWEPNDLQREILLRPTFFQHHDRVIVDWKYLDRRDGDRLKKEAGWLTQQKVLISVDLASGINLFPDLRIVNNDSAVYAATLSKIKSVIHKMQLIGADELLISSMRPIENNFTTAAFRTSLIETYRQLADLARSAGITLVFRPLPGTMYNDVESSLNVVKEVGRSNFVYAASLSMLSADPERLEKNLDLLQAAGIERVFVAGCRKDLAGKVVDYNYPLSKASSKEELLRILSLLQGKSFYLDAVYSHENEEYDDNKMISRGTGEEEKSRIP